MTREQDEWRAIHAARFAEQLGDDGELPADELPAYLKGTVG